MELRICQACLTRITNSTAVRNLVVTEYATSSAWQRTHGGGGDQRTVHAYTEPDTDTVLTLCGERYASQSPALTPAEDSEMPYGKIAAPARGLR